MIIKNITSEIPQGNYTVGRGIYVPKAIVLHITADDKYNNAVNWFRDPRSVVSAHYVIEKNGDVFMCVSPANKAYQCGIINKPTAKIYTDMGNINPNNYTIGIECVSKGEKLTDAQHNNLIQLINDLCKQFNIPITRYNIIGHNELDSVNRVNDPIISYSVDDIVKELVKPVELTFEQILERAGLTNLGEWKEGIRTAVNAAKTDGNLGALEIFQFLPILIKKVYNSK